MKIKNVLMALAFVFAIGSALASEFLAPEVGFTRKADIVGQTADCEPRAMCSDGSTLCTIAIDHDDDPSTDDVPVQLYGVEQNSSICTKVLKRN